MSGRESERGGGLGGREVHEEDGGGGIEREKDGDYARGRKWK